MERGAAMTRWAQQLHPPAGQPSAAHADSLRLRAERAVGRSQGARGFAAGAWKALVALTILFGAYALTACNALLNIEPASLYPETADSGPSPSDMACDGGCSSQSACRDGELRCADDRRLERCRDGSFQTQMVCATRCEDGACQDRSDCDGGCMSESKASEDHKEEDDGRSCTQGQTSCRDERTLALCIAGEYQDILSCPTACNQGSCTYRAAPDCGIPADTCAGQVSGTWKLRSACSAAEIPLGVYAFAKEPGCAMVLDTANVHVGGVVTIADPLAVQGGAQSWYALHGEMGAQCFASAPGADDCTGYAAKLKEQHMLDARCSLSDNGHCRCDAFTMAKWWLRSEDVQQQLEEQAYCAQDSVLHLSLPGSPTDTAVELMRLEDRDVGDMFFGSQSQQDGFFGADVALSGADTLIVAAPGEDNGRGAVYAFTYEAERGWVETQRLAAPEPSEARAFGFALAIQGNTLAASAASENEGMGAVYVFALADGQWTLQQRVIANQGETNDLFGYSLSLSDELLVVGARGEDSANRGTPGDNTAEESGAAYVFRKVDGKWVQEAYLKPDVVGREDYFGDSVSVRHGVVAVGAPYEASAATGVNADPKDNSAPRSGAAYVFIGTDSGWQQQAYIKAPSSRAEDRFGQYVSLSSSGARLAIGASRASGGSGATYVFEYEDGSWNLRDSVLPDEPMSGADFGAVIALDDDLAAIGAQRVGRADVEAIGAVYVFERSATGWAQKRVLEPSVGKPGDEFGAAVAAASGWVAVGVPNYDGHEELSGQLRPVFDSGAVHVFGYARASELRLPPLRTRPASAGGIPGLPRP